MGFSRPILLLSFFVIILTIYLGRDQFSDVENLRSISIPRRYFGKDSSLSNVEDSTIKSFTIPFDRSQVDDVLKRLSETRFPPIQIEIDHRRVNRSTYGFPRETLEMIRDYWMNTFDWKKTVKELNRDFQHYQTNIQVSA